MEISRRDSLPGSIRLLFEVGTVAGMSDGELLDRFLDRRSVGARAAEIAFEALVERHGSMVLRVCRAKLGDEHDAQDAFQATFLILARKARSIRNRDSAASWLQGVARRVAACSRRASAVRRAKERLASRSVDESAVEPDSGELVPAVREEVGDLPEKYRAPLMLCLLDGLTHEEAATRLGWPVGTVKTRVRQAKDRLRTRLARRGFAPTLGAIIASMTAREARALPVSLIRSTSRAGLRYASGKAMTAGAASASVATLVELGIGSLMMTRWKIAALVCTTFGIFAAGTAGYARQGPGAREKTEPVKVKVEVKPPAQAPKAVEVTNEDLIEQLDFARIDLEILQTKADSIKTRIVKLLNDTKSYEATLEQIRRAKSREDLVRTVGMGGGPDFEGNGEFDDFKKLQEASFTRKIDSSKEYLKNFRTAYTEVKRQLRQEEQRIKEMERQATRMVPLQANDTITGSSGDSVPLSDDRIDQIETLKLDVEYLGMIVFQLTSEINNIQRERLETETNLRALAGPQIPGSSLVNVDLLSPAELEKLRKEIQKRRDQVDELLPKRRQELLAQKRELRHKQQELDKLEKPTTGNTPASPPSNPPADVERRLSDVERKLDLILKKLEAGPGKSSRDR